MCISERLKRVLELKNIKTIKEFAEISELPYRTAQSYLNGDREPNVVGLAKLCIQMGLNLNWLVTGTGEIFSCPQQDLLTKREEFLLDNYQHLNETDKSAIERHALALAQQKTLKIGKTA